MRTVQPTIAILSDSIDSPWPMQCHDLRHTSRSPYSTTNVTGLEKWRRHGIRIGFGGVVAVNLAPEVRKVPHTRQNRLSKYSSSV